MMESVLGFIILEFILWIFPSEKIEDVSPQPFQRHLLFSSSQNGRAKTKQAEGHAPQDIKI